jgi:hypothetical protein
MPAAVVPLRIPITLLQPVIEGDVGDAR